MRVVELEDEDDGFVYDEDEIAEARGSRPTEDEQLLLEGTPPAPVLDVLKIHTSVDAPSSSTVF